MASWSRSRSGKWSCIRRNGSSRNAFGNPDGASGSLSSFDPHRKHPRCILHADCAAAIGRAEPVAANPLDAESASVAISLAEVLFHHGDSQQGEICQRIRESRVTVFVRQRLFPSKAMLDVSLVIARRQNHTGPGQRMAVPPAQHPNNDGFVVNHREGLIRAADLSGKKNQSSPKRPCQMSKHAFRPGSCIGAKQIILRLPPISDTIGEFRTRHRKSPQSPSPADLTLGT